jgi:CRISPR-associated protein Cmr3
MNQRLGLCLEPLDVLFFRDSRPFNAGMRGTGGLPPPQTLAGAIRTHLWRQLGMDFDDLAQQFPKTATSEDPVVPIVVALLPPEHAWAASIRIRGPWLCTTATREAPEPFVPIPADLVRPGKNNADGPLLRLHPHRQAPPGWHAPAPGMVPFWHRGREVVERAQGYLTLAGLRRYLNDEELHKEHCRTAQELYMWEERVGIGIDADRNRAEARRLYAVRLLRLQPRIAFYAEVEVDATAPSDATRLLAGTLAFGGEGRRVNVTVLEQPLCWPQTTATGDGTLAILITPGIFGVQGEGVADGFPWRPESSLAPLVAAAVPGARPISGWDLARRRPKPTRQAVVEGSVYCFQGDIAAAPYSPFLHLNSGHLDTLGYGLALRGVWSYA